MTALAIDRLPVTDLARMIASPTPEEIVMARKAQVFLDHAIDRYIGELARRGRKEATRRKYRQVLDPFGDLFKELMPREVTPDHCRRYLDRWANSSPSTLALYVSVLTGFFEFCRDDEIIPGASPMERIRRPPRLRPEDLDVVTVTEQDVERMFRACRGWQETLCLSVLAYMGVRRGAASSVRRRDVDLVGGTVRFVEKGGKTIVKPLPLELLAILAIADEQGVWADGDAYLIPNVVPALVRADRERGHKVIYETVKRIADRAGVESHVHALRAAFAVKFDDAHPDQLIALKELLGHSRIETTLVYLRRKNKAAAMEVVRDLSWRGAVLPARLVVPPAGFEPALPVDADGEPRIPVADAETLPATLLAKALGLAERAKSEGRA